MAAAMETEQLGVEIFETAECEENIESQDRPKLEPFYVERYSWSQLKKLLADTRKYHGYMMAKAPHDFMFVKRNDPDGPHSDRIYYLGEYEVTAPERKFFLSFLFFFFFLIGPHSWHLEVPRLGVELEL